MLIVVVVVVMPVVVAVVMVIVVAVTMVLLVVVGQRVPLWGSDPQHGPAASPPLPLALRFSASPCHRLCAECPHEDLVTEPGTSPSPPPS